jgi:RNA polymerase sigma-70 factor (ECF subfamily)
VSQLQAGRVGSRRADESESGTAATLGDLLYADRSRTRVPEKDWVQLVAAIAAGDQLALRELYERTHAMVFTLTLRIVDDRETAEELTQDVYHDVWRRASRFDPSAGSVVGWIMNQTRSRAIDRLRFERRKKRVNPYPVEVLAEVASLRAPVPEEGEGDRLRHALAVLTPEERAAIETAFFSGLTYAEAAAQLEQPVGTIKTRIRSGLSKLRQAIGAEPS